MKNWGPSGALRRRWLMLVIAVMSAPLQASTLAISGTSVPHNGLRIVSTTGVIADGGVVVGVRVSRTRATHVIAPQRLRFAVVSADGTVQARQERLAGPAQLRRANSQDANLTVNLASLPGATDRVVVEWLAARD